MRISLLKFSRLKQLAEELSRVDCRLRRCLFGLLWFQLELRLFRCTDAVALFGALHNSVRCVLAQPQLDCAVRVVELHRRKGSRIVGPEFARIRPYVGYVKERQCVGERQRYTHRDVSDTVG